MTTMTIPKAEWLASKPAWAKAAITATYEVDKSEMMTDYFATHAERHVFLAWSKHTKDLFPEMRKAAATFAETAHLGPGKDVWHVRIVAVSDIRSAGSAYWKGSYSPWHSELVPHGGVTFETKVEADAFIASKGVPHAISFEGTLASFEWKISVERLEHREKYSMGAGYYLKASGRYSTGWTVEKTAWFDGLGDLIEVPAHALAAAAPTAVEAAPLGVDAPVVAGVTMTLNTEKNGVELRFPAKPSDTVRATLKANGWRWSPYSECWYRRDTTHARAFAESMVANAALLPVSA